MTYTFLKLAKDVLREAKTPLESSEIWDCAKNRGLTEKLNTRGSTPWSTLNAELSTQVLHGGEETLFARTEGRPGRYYLRSRKSEIDFGDSGETIDPNASIIRSETSTETAGYREINLHPLLAYFAYTNLEFSGERQIYTKTIDHANSQKKGFTEWLHPDMVGVYLPFGDLDKQVIRLSKTVNSGSITQLFSFELKLEITPSNYRENYFQAVSNSSWANEGYLVTAKMSNNEELRRELGRLSKSFGIGVIHLNLHDINASRVLFRATQRAELDWDTINKLCLVNTDFSSFIKRLNTDSVAGEVHTFKYEEILKDSDKYIREKFGIETVE